MWGKVERKACATPHKNVAALKAVVGQREWANIFEELAIKSYRTFRCGLEPTLTAEGVDIEK